MDSTGPTGPTDSSRSAILNRLSNVAHAAPRPIATLAELTTSHDAILQKETADKAIVSQISNPNRSAIRASLISWTSRGFPSNFQIFSIMVTPPPICSDGVRRTFAEYVPYLLGGSIADELVKLQPQLVDITLSYTISGNILRIQASK